MTLFKSSVKLFALCFTLCSLSACYPAYKTRQPEVNLTIINAQQLPIESAKVVLITRAHASGVNDFMVKNSDGNGQVLFNSDKQVEVELAFLHGSLQYFWDICVEKKDYITENIRIDEPAQAAKLNKVVLKTGESTACLHK
jgi:hypothetical protein